MAHAAPARIPTHAHMFQNTRPIFIPVSVTTLRNTEQNSRLRRLAPVPIPVPGSQYRYSRVQLFSADTVFVLCMVLQSTALTPTWTLFTHLTTRRGMRAKYKQPYATQSERGDGYPLSPHLDPNFIIVNIYDIYR